MNPPSALPLEEALVTLATEPPPEPSAETPATRRPLSPYPGLRPFRPDESRLFCGRSQNRIELLSRLEESRFLAVIGASGSGKSSLVMAGLLPDIAEGLLLSIEPDTSRVVYFKPGGNPFRALAEGLAKTFDAKGQEAEIERMLRHSSAQGLRKVLDHLLGSEGAGSGQASAVIVVADQFEEVFRFASLEKKDVDSAEFLAARRGVPMLDTAQNEAQAFVDLLLHAYTMEAHVVYVVLTMRSDFLHRCEAFDRLPGVISAHQYLTPRPQRDQLADSIAIPATHFGAKMQPELLNLILNELSPEQDQLPVLEHALARLWEHAVATQGKPSELRIEDYRAIGGIQNALNLHGQEILARVASDSGGTLRDAEVGRFFRCLAEWDPSGLLIRRPRTVAQVAAESGLTIEQVKLIANQFRGASNHWLTPMIAEVEELQPGRPLDLTHESLLRKWDRYSDKTGWMAAEKERRDAFRRLWERMSEPSAAPQFMQRLTPLMRLDRRAIEPATLSHAQLQRFREQLLTAPEPNEAWAERYSGSWREAKRFLDTAIREQRARAGLVIIVLFLFVVLVIVAVSERVRRGKAQVDADKAELGRKSAELARITADEKARTAQDAADEAERRRKETEQRLAFEQEKKAKEQAEAELKEKKNQEVALRQSAPASAAEPGRDLVQTVRDSLVAQIEDSRRALEQARLTETELRAIATAAKTYLAGGRSSDKAALRTALEKQGYLAPAPAAVPAELLPLLAGPVALIGHKQPVEATAFLSIGGELRAVTGGKDRSVKLWSLDGKSAREILKHDATSLRVTDDGRLLASGLDAFLRLWSPDKPALEYRLEHTPPNEAIVSGRMLPDARILIWTTAGRLGLWKSAGVQPEFSAGIHRGAVNATDFLREKNWVLASGDDQLATLWSIEGETPRLLDSVKTGAPVRGAAFDPSGEMALLPSGEKEIQLVRLGGAHSGGKPLSEGRRFPLRHENPVALGKIGPQGDLVATADIDGRVYLWQIAATRSGESAPLAPSVVLKDHRRRVTALEWSPDGRYFVSADESGLILLWSRPASRAAGKYSSLPLVFPSHQGAVTSLSIAPQGDFLLSGGTDATARILPLRPTIAGRCRTTFGGPKDNSGGPTEGLALLTEEDTRKREYEALFLRNYDPAKSGLARRLDPEKIYLAARWDYAVTSRSFLRNNKVVVRNPKTGASVLAQAVDWGPSPSTGAVADLSPGLAKALELKPDDPVEVIADLIPQATKSQPGAPAQ